VRLNDAAADELMRVCSSVRMFVLTAELLMQVLIRAGARPVIQHWLQLPVRV